MRAYEFINESLLEAPSRKDMINGKKSGGIKTAVGAAALAAMGLAGAKYVHHQPTHQIQPSAVDSKEQDVLAKTMWGEARNQGETGMRAVGHVIKNRADAKNKKFGSGIEGVALAPMQFSAWNSHDPNKSKMNDLDSLDPKSEDYKAWKTAQKLAADILSGRDSDPTNGATYYHTTAVHPKWANNMEPSAKIGSHVFYNES